MLLQLAVITPSLTKIPPTTNIDNAMTVGLSDHGRHLALHAAGRLEQLLGPRTVDLVVCAPAVSCTQTGMIAGQKPEEEIEYAPELGYEHSRYARLLHGMVAKHGYEPYRNYEKEVQALPDNFGENAWKSLCDTIADHRSHVALAICYPVILQAMLMQVAHGKYTKEVRELVLAPCEGALINFDDHGGVRNMYPFCIEPARA